MHLYNILNVPQIVKLDRSWKYNSNKYLIFNTNFEIMGAILDLPANQAQLEWSNANLAMLIHW